MCLLPLLYGNSASAGVDCTQSPHTRLEIAICGEPVLSAIDRELTDAVTRAQKQGIIDRQESVDQRNKIARQCWREVDETLISCLHNAELQALEWVASRLGEFDGDAAGISDRVGQRLHEGLAHQKLLLQKQLMIAESRMRRTGNPDLTVATITELMQLNERQQQLQPNNGAASHADADQSIAQLEQKLVTGCNHSVYGKKWRRMVKRYELSCDTLKSKQPELYSAVD